MSESTQPLHSDSEIAASLEFEPVPRKVERVDGWDAETQRAFIAAVAMTGSPRKAARAVDRREAGVENLRQAEGAESFSAAWDRALAIHAATRTGRLRETLERLQSSPERGGGPAKLVEGAWRPAEALPVICDNCRTEGAAGDEAFSGIPDILAFDPVPRSAHDNLWPADVQRAFIAALAVSGSPVRAARSVGRHGFGAEKLRKARGARSFSEAWEAALDLARERELSRLHGKLDELASNPPSREREGLGEGLSDDEEREAEEARERIKMRLENCRRFYLSEICEDEAKRAAYELLCGPVNWDKAARFERQANERSPNFRNPDMIIPIENQWLAELTGGADKTKVLGQAVEVESGTGGGELTR